MMVTNTPTRRTLPRPIHQASEVLARCCIHDHPDVTWDSASEQLRRALINQAERVISRIDTAGWLIIPKRKF